MYKNIIHPRGRPFAECLECSAGSRSLSTLCDVNGALGEPLAGVEHCAMLEHVLTFPQLSYEDLLQLVYAVAQTLLDVLILYLSFFLVPKTKNPGVFSSRVFEV